MSVLRTLAQGFELREGISGLRLRESSVHGFGFQDWDIGLGLEFKAWSAGWLTDEGFGPQSSSRHLKSK